MPNTLRDEDALGTVLIQVKFSTNLNENGAVRLEGHQHPDNGHPT